MIDKLRTQFLEHLRYERNVSEHTLRNYASDLEQFLDYLAPTENKPADQTPTKRATSQKKKREPDLNQIDHITIREWLSSLHSAHKKKTSIARKLAALRT